VCNLTVPFILCSGLVCSYFFQPVQAADAVDFYIPSGAAVLNSEVDGITFGDNVEFSFRSPSTSPVTAKKVRFFFVIVPSHIISCCVSSSTEMRSL
jgi:hypothetical protein